MLGPQHGGKDGRRFCQWTRGRLGAGEQKPREEESPKQPVSSCGWLTGRTLVWGSEFFSGSGRA